MRDPSLLAVDWGTSSLRAYLLDETGAVLKRHSAPMGIRSVVAGGYETVFSEQCLPLIAEAPDTPVLMCGMVGSRQGWQEAPYVTCPTSLDVLADGVLRVRTEVARISIVPGLSYQASSGMIDVIRGEETQILGASAGDAISKGLICVPGTHSKWCHVSGERIEAFSTYLTGEMFEILRKHSVISQGLPEAAAIDSAAFLAGLERAAQGGSLLHEVFGVRTAWLFETFPPECLPGFLSGLLIGTEVQHATVQGVDRVGLIASGSTADNYRAACSYFGVECEALSSENVTVAGLWAVARQLTLV
ncbi:2-dehydro-3-deoxygalactonokinase [Shimia sediminis]|uniref:2-dehydro-3-deoxygalactonokinase n=1 Tax=Shimia sediminis TaxID=2497945 RepID=UPI000F8C9B00|nr:2-dehydro-3-deoxygalactonokinase [Shimia sediminis]